MITQLMFIKIMNFQLYLIYLFINIHTIIINTNGEEVTKIVNFNNNTVQTTYFNKFYGKTKPFRFKKKPNGTTIFIKKIKTTTKAVLTDDFGYVVDSAEYSRLYHTTTKKILETDDFGYDVEYEEPTLPPHYYDTALTTDLFVDRFIYDFENNTEFANNREMYRKNKWLRFMNRGEAQMIQEELRNRYGYTLAQITELNGLTVARAIERHYHVVNYTDVLVFCGSGNNGLDGMVTARHLKLMGYDPTIFLIKDYNQTREEGYKLFTRLKKQCLAFNIPILNSLPSNVSLITHVHKLFVDAIFGYNYEREKYLALPKNNKYRYGINILRQINRNKHIPIVSIDLPSGWDTNIGNYEGYHINPHMLVSLICPKVGVIEFFGHYHYIGGNYLPELLNEKYQLYVPKYNGSDCLQQLDTQEPDLTTEANECFRV